MCPPSELAMFILNQAQANIYFNADMPEAHTMVISYSGYEQSHQRHSSLSEK